MGDQNEEELDRRINEIKKKSELLLKRREEVLADQRHAEKTGSSITNFMKTSGTAEENILHRRSHRNDFPREESSGSDDGEIASTSVSRSYERAWDRGKVVSKNRRYSEKQDHDFDDWNARKIGSRENDKGISDRGRRNSFRRQPHRGYGRSSQQKRPEYSKFGRSSFDSMPRKDESYNLPGGQGWKTHKSENEGKTKPWEQRNRKSFPSRRGSYDGNEWHQNVGARHQFPKRGGQSRGSGYKRDMSSDMGHEQTLDWKKNISSSSAAKSQKESCSGREKYESKDENPPLFQGHLESLSKDQFGGTWSDVSDTDDNCDSDFKGSKKSTFMPYFTEEGLTADNEMTKRDFYNCEARKLEAGHNPVEIASSKRGEWSDDSGLEENCEAVNRPVLLPLNLEHSTQPDSSEALNYDECADISSSESELHYTSHSKHFTDDYSKKNVEDNHGALFSGMQITTKSDTVDLQKSVYAAVAERTMHLDMVASDNISVTSFDAGLYDDEWQSIPYDENNHILQIAPKRQTNDVVQADAAKNDTGFKTSESVASIPFEHACTNVETKTTTGCQSLGSVDLVLGKENKSDNELKEPAVSKAVPKNDSSIPSHVDRSLQNNVLPASSSHLVDPESFARAVRVEGNADENHGSSVVKSDSGHSSENDEISPEHDVSSGFKKSPYDHISSDSDDF